MNFYQKVHVLPDLSNENNSFVWFSTQYPMSGNVSNISDQNRVLALTYLRVHYKFIEEYTEARVAHLDFVNASIEEQRDLQKAHERYLKFCNKLENAILTIGRIVDLFKALKSENLSKCGLSDGVIKKMNALIEPMRLFRNELEHMEAFVKGTKGAEGEFYGLCIDDQSDSLLIGAKKLTFDQIKEFAICSKAYSNALVTRLVN